MTETRLTLTQFAEHVGVKPRKLWKWIAAGYIKPTFMREEEPAFSAEDAAVARCFALLKRNLALSPDAASRYAAKIRGAKDGDKLIIASRDVAKTLGINAHNNHDPRSGIYLDVGPIDRVFRAHSWGAWPGLMVIDVASLKFKNAAENDDRHKANYGDDEANSQSNNNNNDDNNDNNDNNDNDDDSD